MVFVNEVLDKEKRSRFGRATSWTVDHEREAALISHGGVGPSNNKNFEFYYKGKSTKFFATYHYGRNEQGQNYVDWGIPPLGMREFPLEEHREIKEMILEAFKIYCFAGEFDKEMIVTAKFGSDLKVN
jgi:hypothetical protein